MKIRLLVTAIISMVILSLFACSTPKYQPISIRHHTPYLAHNAAIMADGYRLPLSQHIAEEASAVIIALHGFNDYRQAFQPLCEYVVDHHIHCYRYDQRGFGETRHRGLWPNNGEHQQDLVTLAKLIKQRHHSLPVYVIGESMGGAVILTTFAENQVPEVDGIAVLAPAVWARHTQPWYQQLALWLSVRIAPGWKPTGKGFERVVSDNNEMLRELSQDPLVIKGTRVDAIYGLNNLMDKALASAGNVTAKGLILYGDKDELITKKPTCEMLGNAAEGKGNWRFVLYSEGYHMLSRDLQAENVYKDLIKWITNPTETFDEELSLKNGQWQADYCQA